MKNKFLLFLALWLAFVSGSRAQNNSLHFDGVDDYVKMDELPSYYPFAHAFSFTAWVKWDVFQGNARLCDLASGTQANNNIIVRINNGTGKIAFQSINGSGKFSEIITDAVVVSTGKWTHVAATLYNGSATIYINGIPVKTGTINVPYAANRSYSYLGKSAWDADQYFKGSMDEVTIWDKALSQQEVVAAMRNGLTGTESNLMVYYRCNEGVANGNNSAVTALKSTATSMLNALGTLKNFDLTNGNTTSNFVDGYSTSDVANTLSAPASITLLNSTSSSKQLGITSNASWNITGVPSWLKLSATSGNGDASITITPNNTTLNPRSATLTLTAPDAISQPITITQIKEAIITLVATPTAFTFGNAANKTGTISITSNTSWSITGNPSWLNLSASSGSKNATITLTTIAANTSTENRTATLKLSAPEAADVTINVTQEKSSATLSVSPTAVMVGAEGEIFPISIQSNLSWSASSSAWIALSKFNGSGDQNITATVPANPFPYSRVGNITFQASSAENKIVSVDQEAGVNAFAGIKPPVGDGSINNPFEISKLVHLYWIAENSNRWAFHYIQTADIDASATSTWFNGMGWPSIGSYESPFTGSYNGLGHVISNITITHTSENSVGFFGSNNGVIQKLGLVNATVKGGSCVGKMVGNNTGTVENCFATGNVTGGMQSGGFVGYNSGIVKNCYSTGSVTVSSFSGGFVGIVNGEGKVQDCYSSGNFSGSGFNYGAFVGQEFSGSITNCHWNTGSQQSGAGSFNGTFIGSYLSSDDIKIQSKFTNWDFLNEEANGTKDVWTFYPSLNNGAPCLSWQIMPVVITKAATDIKKTSATANGMFYTLGVAAPTAHGACWNTTGMPTIANNVANNSSASSIGDYTAAITGLTAVTTYYVRAYATNSLGTSYGEEVSFTTTDKSAITITAPTLVLSKDYDRNVSATITKLGTVSGIDNTDDVTVTATATYDNANAGIGKTITVKYSISGAAATNYSEPENYVVSNGVIVAKPLTASAPTLTTSKEYNRTTVATATTGTVTGILSDDDVTVVPAANYNDFNVGTNKTIVVSYSLSGAAKDNYIAPENFTVSNGEITQKHIYVMPKGWQYKIYGEADPVFTYNIDYSLFDGDTFTGALSRVQGESVSSWPIAIGTLSAGSNYNLEVTHTTFEIKPKALSVTNPSFATSKVYNGTATVDIVPGIVTGIVSGDDVILDIKANYADKNVGTDKPITIAYTLSGNAAGNYSITQPTAVGGAITPAALTITANNLSKPTGKAYAFAGTEFTTTGVFTGDEVSSATLTSDGAAASAPVGTYSIEASNAQGTGIGNYSITYNKGKFNVIDKIAQTITFANPGAQFYGSTPTLTATVTSKLPVTFTTTTPNVCTITSGGALNFAAAGTCTIVADQAGDATYKVAPSVPQSFAVNPVAPAAPTAVTATAGDEQATVSFTPPTNDGGAPVTSYTVNSNTKGITATGTSNPITVTGLTNGITYSFTVTATNAGGTSVASGATNSVTPMHTPVITWNPADITYGTALGEDQLNAKADVLGAFTYTPAAGTVLKAGNTQALSVTFTPDDKAANTTVSKTLTINVDKATPAFRWNTPNSISYGTILDNATALHNGAAVAGTFSYTADGNALKAGDILAAGAHDLTVTFTPTDATNYKETTKTVAISVAKAPLTATATSYSIREGEAIPALGVTYSGFVNGDTEAVLDTKPTATTNATATSPTGVYSITVAGGADDNYDIAYVAGKLTVSNPIVVDALQAPQPACEGDKLSLAYTLTSGRPTEYQIVFDAKALAAGFDNSGYAALPADNGTATFSIPSRVADGTYQGALQLRDGYGNISELAAFQVTVNVSADVIVPKFGNVVLIDNHDGRFTGYQWYRNGSAIGEATNQYYKDPNGLSGTYYAQLKTATGQTLNTCSKALSLKKSAQASVSVYPNPARAGQELTVKLSGFADEELQGAVLSVYSTQGVPVLTSRKVEQENRITLTGTDGVYMGRIATADGQVLTFKVVLAN